MKPNFENNHNEPNTESIWRERITAHEFDVDDSAWERMNTQLSQQEARRKRGGFWLWFFVGCGVLTTGYALTQYLNNPNKPSSAITSQSYSDALVSTNTNTISVVNSSNNTAGTSIPSNASTPSNSSTPVTLFDNNNNNNNNNNTPRINNQASAISPSSWLAMTAQPDTSDNIDLAPSDKLKDILKSSELILKVERSLLPILLTPIEAKVIDSNLAHQADLKPIAQNIVVPSNNTPSRVAARFNINAGLNLPIYGQNFLSINQNTFNIANPSVYEYSQERTSSSFAPSLVAGVGVELAISKHWTILSGLQYQQQRGVNLSQRQTYAQTEAWNNTNLNVPGPIAMVSTKRTDSLITTKVWHFISLPVVADYTIGKKHHLNAGLSLNVLFNTQDNNQSADNATIYSDYAGSVQTTNESSSTNTSGTNKNYHHFSPLDLGITFGYAYDISSHIRYSLTYNAGLTDMTRGNSYGGGKHFHNNLQVSIAYRF